MIGRTTLGEHVREDKKAIYKDSLSGAVGFRSKSPLMLWVAIGSLFLLYPEELRSP